MPISCICPHCGVETTLCDEHAGKSEPCANCGQTVTIPAAAGQAVADAPDQEAEMPHRQPTSGGLGCWVKFILLIIVVNILGMLMANVFSRIQAYREAGRQEQCQNSMKQLGLAMHMFHDSNKRFPGYDDPAHPDDPPCSWRVHLLPFHESDDVHERYDRTQPWNSVTNIALENDVWHYCKCPSNSDSLNNIHTETDYVSIVGPHCFSREKANTTIDDITDGESNTIMFIESAATGIHWMEPRDLKFEDARIVDYDSTDNGIRSHHPDVFNVTLCDGGVKSVSTDIDPKLLKALMTIDGGESVESFHAPQ